MLKVNKPFVLLTSIYCSKTSLILYVCQFTRATGLKLKKYNIQKPLPSNVSDGVQDNESSLTHLPFPPAGLSPVSGPDSGKAGLGGGKVEG